MKNKTHTKRKGQRLLPAAPCYAPLVILPTSTTPEELVKLKDAGYVTLCCDAPEKVKVVLPQTLASDDLLMAAMHGLAGTCSSNERSKMVEELHRRLLKKEGA